MSFGFEEKPFHHRTEQPQASSSDSPPDYDQSMTSGFMIVDVSHAAGYASVAQNTSSLPVVESRNISFTTEHQLNQVTQYFGSRMTRTG